MGLLAGEGVLEKLLKKAKSEGGAMKGADAFLMYDTYGFPLELTQEVAADNGLTVDEEGFQVAMEEQRTRSKVWHSSPHLLRAVILIRGLYQNILVRYCVFTATPCMQARY